MKKLLLTIFSVIFMEFILFSPLIVRAEEVNTSIFLNKDYQEAVFQFTFIDEQAHTIEITTPTGEIVKKESESADVIVKVPFASAGSYSVRIEADAEIDYDAKVECINVPVSESTSSVTVTSQFSNLILYFSNGNFCAVWDDNGIGKVNIEVTNPSTMQKIAKETVTGTSYSLALGSSVNEIEVYIVPSNEAKIDGAGITYTLPVVREVNGSVSIPEITLTNQEYVPIHVTLSDENMWVQINDNGEKTYLEKLEKGEHTVKAPLNGVNNDLEVFIIDKNHNRISYTFSVTKDIVAPSLSLAKIYNGTVTTDAEILVEGYVKNASTLLINNEEVVFDKNGSFSYSYELTFGVNSISICAVDDAGNEAVVVTEVTREEDTSIPTAYYIIGFVILLLILLIIMTIKKTSGKAKAPAKEPKPKKNKKKDVKIEETAEDKQKNNKSKSSRKKSRRVNNEIPYVQRRRKASRKALIASIIVKCMFFAAIFFIATKCIFISSITSSSMGNTLMTGDCVLFNRFAYMVNEIERGDIVVYYNEAEGAYVTKRVIGLEGDNIEFRNGDVYINNLFVDESAYLPEDVETNCSKSFTVPEGTLFLLGDNREDSYDSRFYPNPYIRKDMVIGKYFGHIRF